MTLQKLKVLPNEDDVSRLTNLMSYMWLRGHYNFKDSFSKFCKYSEFEIWNKDHIIGRQYGENGFGMSQFYKLRQ